MAPTYEDDAYLTRIETEVLEAGEEDGRAFAVTADTVLYPEGGGQPSDHGTLGGVRVTGVLKSGQGFRHDLDQAIAPGPVVVELDWERRWDHMQQHTAQHLLTAVADRLFGWPTTAFHLGPDVSDVELGTENISDQQRSTLEQAIADEIRAARPVTTRIVEASELEDLGARSRGLPDDHSGPVRLVEIAGVDLNTCGGTHLRSTAEIGALALIGSERLRGGIRLFFAAGDRVRRRMTAHENRNARLRTLLGAPDAELAEAVEARLAREHEINRQNRRLLKELADLEAERLGARPEGVITAHWADRDMAFLQTVGRSLASRSPSTSALLTAGPDNQGFFLIVVAEDNADAGTAAVAAACEILDGRGGGSGRLFQGKATALGRRDEAAATLGEHLT